MAYLKKRDAKKKQLNGTTTTSVYNTVDPQQNGRKLQRQNTVNMVRIRNLEILTTLKSFHILNCLFPINVFIIFFELFFFLRKHRRMTDVYTRHIQTQIPAGRTPT